MKGKILNKDIEKEMKGKEVKKKKQFLKTNSQKKERHNKSLKNKTENCRQNCKKCKY